MDVYISKNSWYNTSIMGKCRVCKEGEATAGYGGKCLRCGRLYQQQWRDANREKYNAYSRKWRREHKKDGISYDSKYPSQRVPNYLRGQVEVCRAMRAASLSSKPCEECGKMASEMHERESGDNLRLCRECHLKYH